MWLFLPGSQIQKTKEISSGSEILAVKERLTFAFPSLYLTMCTFYICLCAYLPVPKTFMLYHISDFQIQEASSLI